MRRLVLDPGVFVSALITPTGVPATLLGRIREGEFEVIVSPQLLEELRRVLSREKFRRYFDLKDAQDYIAGVERDALVAPDPEAPPPLHCADPKDDYLIALAFRQNAILVSGDKDLLEIGGGAPILAPADLQQQPA